jgi:biopolymer transport protein ExbB
MKSLQFVYTTMLMLAVSCASTQLLAAPAATNAAAATVQNKTLIDYYCAGGILMHPMTIGLFGVVWLTIYHMLTLRRSRMIPADDIVILRNLLYQRDTLGALAYCEQHPSFLATALAGGVAKLGDNEQNFNRPAAETAILDAIDRQETRMSFWLNLMSVIAALSPMLGLLGTVQGMIAAFDTIGKGGMGKPELLAGDIGVALITTFYDLIIGIPAMLAFFLFRGMFNAHLSRVSAALNELLDIYTGEGIARQRFEQMLSAHPPQPDRTPDYAHHAAMPAHYQRQAFIPDQR